MYHAARVLNLAFPIGLECPLNSTVCISHIFVRTSVGQTYCAPLNCPGRAGCKLMTGTFALSMGSRNVGDKTRESNSQQLRGSLLPQRQPTMHPARTDDQVRRVL
jgi:hypothetical protein